MILGTHIIHFGITFIGQKNILLFSFAFMVSALRSKSEQHRSKVKKEGGGSLGWLRDDRAQKTPLLMGK